MKKSVAFVLMMVAALGVAGAAYGQKKESLAVLPFTGVQTSDGETIARAFARAPVWRDAFNGVMSITRATQEFIQFEQRFQRMSGLTDADTIFELGKQLNASHVMTGYTTKFGNRNLALVSILDVESLQLIAGEYRVYTKIEEVADMIPDMARNMARAVGRDTSKLPGLSVPPFSRENGINESDAQTLAQILAIGLANGNKYAVLPRTDSLEKVREEHSRQRSGQTDQERVKRLGVGRNAEYVLVSSVGTWGSLLSFDADVHNIESMILREGFAERYKDFSEGLELIPRLAARLNGETITAAPAAPAPAQAAPAQKPMPANMVRIGGGTFTMGSPTTEASRGSDESPQHQVTISKPFYIGKYEVTQKEWTEVMGTTIHQQRALAGYSGDSTYGVGDNYPMYYVSWYDAVEYCNKRSAKEGLAPAYTIDKTRSDGNNGNGGDNVKWVVTRNVNATGYRLPTEAEWELACRAGTSAPFYTGNNITTNHANYNGNYPYNNNAKGEYRQRTWAVGSGTPNPWGLYDMSGNVWEWCWDWYGSYSSGSQTDPSGAAAGSDRVERGGSWNDDAQNARSAYRGSDTPSGRSVNLGFRLVRP
ncbi:MAG: formylglycine-generating enzyme family protein [Treponema sp.]|jgi:formylglycine-generating enzyme required for sulfatase activity|nr:formylglycine-generating enzyme family protein [Treponema sp.]